MIKRMGNRLKDQKGFTLVELLAVIVILGIIAAIAIPSIGGIIQNTKEDSVKADAITILNAAKMEVAANGTKKATAAGVFDQDDLAQYIDSEESLIKTYSVTYTAPSADGKTGATYKLNAGPITIGNVKLTFTNATIKDINADSGDGDRVIPKAGA